MFVKTAKAVFSPLDEQWDLTRSSYSPELAKRMVWLSALLPYDQCALVFQKIGEQWIPASSIWRQTQVYGAELQVVCATHQTAVALETYALPTELDPCSKGLSMDGGMVNIRNAGWRELKVGAVFDLVTGFENHPVTGHLLKMTHGVNIQYTAVLDTKETFERALWALAVTTDFATARSPVAVADGAVWIWDVVDDLFPTATQVVDWYHAIQHLVLAAQALYPTDDLAQQKCLKAMKTNLYDGKIALIIQPLLAADHADLALYFQRHQTRMNYSLFRQNGFPLGSGTVESGVKQFKHRLAGAGMHWQLENAQRMVVLRAAVLSDTFDDLWEAA